MLSEYAVQVKAILYVARLFGDDYVRQHRFSACSVLCYEFTDDEANVFLGFEGDNKENKWTEFASMAVNKITGDVRFLDYKLPSGRRMAKPVQPIIYA